MSPFSAFMFWLALCWLVYACKVEPLQPDQITDDLADVDLDDVHRNREACESLYARGIQEHSDIVTHARRMRPYRQRVIRG